jgi:hypothetical protein
MLGKKGRKEGRKGGRKEGRKMRDRKICVRRNEGR